MQPFRGAFTSPIWQHVIVLVVGAHLGAETQQQSLDPAIDRTTPVLLGLFSLITLWANDHYTKPTPVARTAIWHPKSSPTFSDALASVRRQLWLQGNFQMSRQESDPAKISPATLNTLINLACYAA
jgi:hypothetical protein